MVPEFRMIGRPDPCFAWDGTGFYQLGAANVRAHSLDGAFAGICQEPEGISLLRDPLGLNKLFWAPCADSSTVEVAARLSHLTDRGHRLEDCAAVPANTLIVYRPRRPPTTTPVVDPAPPPDLPADPEARLTVLARRIHDAVDAYIEAVVCHRPGPVVVCLSGGLDSTSIAALIAARRPDAVAVTFDLDRPGFRSDDFRAAHQTARQFGLEFVPAIHRPDKVLEMVDRVLWAGSDWRDFNVHAGLVNAALATTIRELFDTNWAVTVFTGDLVNEFLADYRPETHRGNTYYQLPRLSLPALRDSLVGGLQGVHREIGVFADAGLVVVQPYAAARQGFLALPDAVLGPGEGKSLLYQQMFGASLPGSVHQRPKTRAQTGSVDGGGVLGCCVDAGIDARYLAARFAELHHTTPAQLSGFMRGGRARTGIPRGDDDPAR